MTFIEIIDYYNEHVGSIANEFNETDSAEIKRDMLYRICDGMNDVVRYLYDEYGTAFGLRPYTDMEMGEIKDSIYGIGYEYENDEDFDEIEDVSKERMTDEQLYYFINLECMEDLDSYKKDYEENSNNLKYVLEDLYTYFTEFLGKVHGLHK